MPGEKELQKLLTTMRPELQAGEYVFCSISPELFEQLDIQPVGWFREAEGITLIVDKSVAEQAGLTYAFVSRMITLTVHSSLEAVGFLAAITRALADAGISVNPVSAYYHDHLFVPSDKAERAMQLLAILAQSHNLH
jgi:uncharacterized protein